MTDTTWDKRHGGAYDRGTTDSYYRRSFEPHYYVGATYSSDMVSGDWMSAHEKAAYTAGYSENDDYKDWN